MLRIVLIRLYETEKQTIGRLFVFKDVNIQYSCCTLELPWLNNEPQKSCIPKGIYRVKKRLAKESSVYRYDHFHIQDVPNRSMILIHRGNFYNHTKGCILVGTSLSDINKDNELDVINSKEALDNLVTILNDNFYIEII